MVNEIKLRLGSDLSVLQVREQNNNDDNAAPYSESVEKECGTVNPFRQTPRLARLGICGEREGRVSVISWFYRRFQSLR